MKSILILISMLQVGSAFAGSGLDEKMAFGPNPGNLRMFIHVPANMPDSISNVPLVVALHGCTESARMISRQSGWNQLADKQNFIVIYPQQKIINNASKCFNWFNSKDNGEGKGESASIMSMIDFAIEHYNIDTSEIFIYGLSAGALMSVALMVNSPNTFKSGAALAGGPYGASNNALAALSATTNPPNKTPEEWGRLASQNTRQQSFPHLVVVHGTKDKVIDIQSSLELIEQWTYIHHTGALPDSIVYSFDSNPLVERFSYLDSTGTEVVAFYKVHKTGHALPVDPGNGLKQGGATGMFAVDRDFHSTYYIAKDFGLLE